MEKWLELEVIWLSDEETESIRNFQDYKKVILVKTPSKGGFRV